MEARLRQSLTKKCHNQPSSISEVEYHENDTSLVLHTVVGPLKGYFVIRDIDPFLIVIRDIDGQFAILTRQNL